MKFDMKKYFAFYLEKNPQICHCQWIDIILVVIIILIIFAILWTYWFIDIRLTVY